MDFSFSHPQYLWLLFSLPLLFFIHFFALSSRRKKALKFANFDAIARIEGIDFFSKNVVVLFMNVLIAALLIFAVSGLTIHTFAKSSSFSFVIAIDSSQSMEATDFSPNRITAAKQTAVTFLNEAPIGTRVGIISFSGGSKIEHDMTERKDELKSAIFDIGISGLGGTDLYEAVLTSSNLLKNENQKAVILLSDGQLNVGNIDDAISYANENSVVIHTIGIGTVEGGETEFGISKLDEDSLKSLAYNTGGQYFNPLNSQNLTDTFLGLYDLTERKVAVPLLDYLIVFAIILLVLEFFTANTRFVNLP